MKNNLTAIRINEILGETAFYPNIIVAIDFINDETRSEGRYKDFMDGYVTTGKFSGLMLYGVIRHINKKVSYARNNRTKLKILYDFSKQYSKSKTYDHEYRKLYEVVYDNYNDGYSYPLQHYFDEFTDCLVNNLRIDGHKYVEQSNQNSIESLETSMMLGIDSSFVHKSLIGLSNKEIGLIEHNKILDEIEDLICNIEIEKYCNKEIEKLSKGEMLQIIEHEPDPIIFETQIKEIAWLLELGIVKHILDNCEEYGRITKAANIIHSFTKHIKLETIRRCIEAIDTPNDLNKKNHPFTNGKNKTFVNNLAISLDWNKKE